VPNGKHYNDCNSVNIKDNPDWMAGGVPASSTGKSDQVLAAGPASQESQEPVYRFKKDARAELFNYIGLYFNPKRRHSYVGGVSPEAFEHASSYDL